MSIVDICDVTWLTSCFVVLHAFHIRSLTSSSRNGWTKRRGSQNPRQLLQLQVCKSFCVHSWFTVWIDWIDWIHQVSSCELTLLDTVFSVKLFGQGLLSMESCKSLRMVGISYQRCRKSWSVGGSVLLGLLFKKRRSSVMWMLGISRGSATMQWNKHVWKLTVSDFWFHFRLQVLFTTLASMYMILRPALSTCVFSDLSTDRTRGTNRKETCLQFCGLQPCSSCVFPDLSGEGC